MHVLFLTRKFPPSQGGMETFSYQLTKNYGGEHTVVHHGSKQWHIVWIAPLLIWEAYRRRHTVDIIHLGDLVLAPIAPVLKWLTGKPVVATAHALELTFGAAGGLYQKCIQLSLPSLDHIVAVSDYTARLVRKQHVPTERISVITHGIIPPIPVHHADARRELQLTDDQLVLLTVGRFVKRKGVAWFIQHVLPRLVEEGLNPLYLVVSDGPDRPVITATIDRARMQNYVRVLGKVSDSTLATCYSGADIWVAPNIAVTGDAEGFGFASLEAASYGLPVLAANIEGIPSAIHHEKNGLLVQPQDADAWITALLRWAHDAHARQAFGAAAARYTAAQFQWKQKAAEYEALFTKIVH